MKILTTTTLFFTLFFMSTSFGQSIQQVKLAATDVATLEKNLSNGSITFYFNTKIDAENVNSSAKYYTEYFSVKFDKASGKTVLNYVDDSAMAKKVTVRFLKSNNIDELILGDKTITTEEFMEKYLK